jgi:hypothetical protein
MKNSIKILLLVASVFFVFKTSAQSYNGDKVSMSNFIKRMYESAPFEGAKVFSDYDNKYLLSVLSLDKSKYTSQSTMMRVAQVKAQSQASTFLNGSITSEDFIVRTTEQKQGKNNETITSIETIQTIKENSVGFVKGLELLTNFDIEEGKRMLFIYMIEIK